jgi:hypothetical protein
MAKQFGGHAQVTLSATDVHMTQIGRQLGQQELHICAIAVPSNQARHRKGVPKVVQPGLVAGVVGATNTGGLAQLLEDALGSRS